ncbi:MAG TPA: MFS transporter, partial [Candidatus Agrococcus pullicola]|nr:MFS transporter [Candidatus Agrococcus pullicola]
MTSTRPLFAARLGTSLAFGIVGFLFAVWLVHIPAVQSATGVSKGELGTALLALGLGSIAGMQIGGSVIARFGARWPLLIGHVIMVATLLGPALSGGLWTLMAALLLFGIGNGLADVAMNAEAVEVERDKGKAIMSSMHAFFSVGTAVGAGYGWLVQTLSWPTLTSFTVASGLGLVAAIVAMALIPSRSMEPEPTTAEMMIASR